MAVVPTVGQAPKGLPTLQKPVLEPAADAGGVLMALALERPQAASETHRIASWEGRGICQARGCGPRCSGSVRPYEVRAEDHCPECEAGEPVSALILHNVALCGAHAQYAIGLGMVPLPGVR